MPNPERACDPAPPCSWPPCCYAPLRSTLPSATGNRCDSSSARCPAAGRSSSSAATVTMAAGTAELGVLAQPAGPALMARGDGTRRVPRGGGPCRPAAPLSRAATRGGQSDASPSHERPVARGVHLAADGGHRRDGGLPSSPGLERRQARRLRLLRPAGPLPPARDTRVHGPGRAPARVPLPSAGPLTRSGPSPARQGKCSPGCAPPGGYREGVAGHAAGPVVGRHGAARRGGGAWVACELTSSPSRVVIHCVNVAMTSALFWRVLAR